MGKSHTPESFWARGRREGSCLVWTGGRSRRGYGNVSFRRRQWVVSRLAWTLTRGPIPEGMSVLHTCDNPPCFEPSHLFLGTLETNMADMKSKGRHLLGVKPGSANPSAKLNEAQIIEIRRLAATGQGPRAIARKFDVSHQHVSRILRGLRWSQPLA